MPTNTELLVAAAQLPGVKYRRKYSRHASTLNEIARYINSRQHIPYISPRSNRALGISGFVIHSTPLDEKFRESPIYNAHSYK